MSITDLAGKPNEYFFHDKGQLSYQNWDISDYGTYIKRVYEAASTANNVFGAKLLGGHLKTFLHQLWSATGGPDNTITMRQRFDFIFPNPQFVWITRRNKIRQAALIYWAIQTGQWVWTGETPTETPHPPDYHYESIDHLLQEIIIHEAMLQEFFTELGSKPFVVVYEDFIEEVENTCRAVLDFLNIDVPADHRFRERKSRVPQIPLLEEWVHTFRQDKQRGWQTKYW
jgi:LPS sulfotransferase NodH